MAAFCLLVFASPLSAVSEDSDAADGEKSTQEDGDSTLLRGLLPEASIHGHSVTSYRGRWTGDGDDQDLYEYLSISLEDLIPARLDAELSLRLREDFDDASHPLNFSDDLFIDVDETRDDQWADRIGTAWLDIHDLGLDHSSLRIGRQYLPVFDGLHVDGARLALDRLGERFDFVAFGGRPVSYFSSTHGDSALGAAGTYRFSPYARMRAKYYRYTDDGRNLDDDQAELELWMRRGNWAFFHASLGTLDSDLKDLILDGKLILHDLDAYLILRYYRLLSEIEDNTLEFSPFFAVLNELEPFSRSDIRLTKSLADCLDIFGGVSIRKEDSGSDDSGYVANSDYQRYDLGLTLYPCDDLSITATGQHWDIDSGRRFMGVTSEVAYKPIDTLTVSAGNAYGEYRVEYYDSFQQTKFKERPDVRTYFASLKWRALPNATLSTKFEIEDNDEEDDLFYRLYTSFGVRF